MNRHIFSALLGGILTLSMTFSAAAVTASQAIESGWNTFSSNVEQTWSQPQHDDFYLPAITWHNRWTYDDEHIEKYNERPWGAGGGVSRWDEKGNWHGL